MDNQYCSQTYKIETFDVNNRRELKLSSLQKFLQQIGEEHMISLSLPYDMLINRDIAFLIVSCECFIFSLPKMGDKVTVTTWSTGKVGAQYMRFYKICDENGNILISAGSMHVPINPKTGGIYRDSGVFPEDLFYGLNPLFEMKKLKIDNVLPNQHYSRKIVYTDIDYNNHLNNTVYVDFLSDYADINFEKQYIDYYNIYYKRQAVINDSMEIYVSKTDDTINYVGTINEKTSFTAVAKYKNR